LRTKAAGKVKIELLIEVLLQLSNLAMETAQTAASSHHPMRKDSLAAKELPSDAMKQVLQK